MVSTLVHRGPDEDGLWADGGIALGMRRLSILDIETGHQPMFNEDNTIAVVFNGEIYNYLELRQELVAAGHRFRTDHSDTEVLVHLYEQYGDAFLDHLNGMFAIAIWDGPRRRLLLARDRAGIKPLYYAPLANGIAFGSEPKALLAHPEISREPDPVALHHYFSLKNIPAPLSAFKAIRQLRAGELLVYADSRITTRRWWRIRFRENRAITEQDAAAQIRALLEDSVRLQMRSDVPVGAYLSGGVDSSSVVALMSGLGARNVKTFTLVYEDELPNKASDRAFAQQVSSMYGTEHHEQFVRFKDVPEKLDAILCAFDEPFSGVISTFFLTQLISRHVKVALSGDGADELFGSYLAHRLAQPLEMAKADPSLLDRTDRPARCSATRRMAAVAEPTGARRRSIATHGAVPRRRSAETRALYRRDAGRDRRNSTEAALRELYGKCGSTDPLNRALFIDFETLLPDQVLPFVDRLSMAHSVEVRPPFLDHRLVEFVATLPGWMKIKQGRVKSILKDAVSRSLAPGPGRSPEGRLCHADQRVAVAGAARLCDGNAFGRTSGASWTVGFRGGCRPHRAILRRRPRPRRPHLESGRFQMWWERYAKRTPT